MTSRLHDPLDLLMQLPTPEPDAARMQATVTAARVRFAEGGTSRPVPGARRPRWWRWAGAGGTALAAVAMLAVVMPQPNAPQTAGRGPVPSGEGRDLAREPPPGRLAEAPPVPAADPPGTVMGARPPQALPPADAPLLPRAESHDFDSFQIVVREVSDEVTLSFLRDGTEMPFDRRRLDPGIGFDLLDAALLAPTDAPELLLLQSRIGDATNWDVFNIGPDGIRLSAELSRRVHDAPDRAAAAQRLSGPD